MKETIKQELIKKIRNNFGRLFNFGIILEPHNKNNSIGFRMHSPSLTKIIRLHGVKYSNVYILIFLDKYGEFTMYIEYFGQYRLDYYLNDIEKEKLFKMFKKQENYIRKTTTKKALEKLENNLKKYIEKNYL